MPTRRWIVVGWLVWAVQTDASSVEMLSGCWKGFLNGSEVEERWDSPSGGLMLGTSKTVGKGVALEFEFLKISLAGKKTVYTPFIGGKEASSFTLNETDSNATKLVFENPANPFPKKIQYQLSRSALKILLTDGGSQNIDYVLDKTRCD